MSRVIGGALMVLAILICLASVVSALAVSELMEQMVAATGLQQGATTAAADGSLAIGTLSQAIVLFGGMVVLVVGGVLVSWALGLLGYVIYPLSVASSPGARKVIDLGAVVAALLFSILALLVLLLLTLGFLQQNQVPGLEISGLAFFTLAAGCVLLASLGVTAIVRGVRSLRGPALVSPVPARAEPDTGQVVQNEPERESNEPVA